MEAALIARAESKRDQAGRTPVRLCPVCWSGYLRVKARRRHVGASAAPACDCSGPRVQPSPPPPRIASLSRTADQGCGRTRGQLRGHQATGPSAAASPPPRPGGAKPPPRSGSREALAPNRRHWWYGSLDRHVMEDEGVSWTVTAWLGEADGGAGSRTGRRTRHPIEDVGVGRT